MIHIEIRTLRVLSAQLQAPVYLVLNQFIVSIFRRFLSVREVYVFSASLIQIAQTLVKRNVQIIYALVVQIRVNALICRYLQYATRQLEHA